MRSVVVVAYAAIVLAIPLAFVAGGGFDVAVDA